MSEPKPLAEIYFCMLQQLSVKQYSIILSQTLLGMGLGDRIIKNIFKV